MLPLPFAALPVVVVLFGAMTGSSEHDELVTRDDPTAVINELVSIQAQSHTDVTLAQSSTASTPLNAGCDDSDLITQS